LKVSLNFIRILSNIKSSSNANSNNGFGFYKFEPLESIAMSGVLHEGEPEKMFELFKTNDSI
jgi:hypothetical protein